MADRELDVDIYDGLATPETWVRTFRDAIDYASDRDIVTWLTEDGKRIAAIVPVDMAEYADVTKHLWRHSDGRPQTASEFNRLGRLDRKLAVQNRRNQDVP